MIIVWTGKYHDTCSVGGKQNVRLGKAAQSGAGSWRGVLSGWRGPAERAFGRRADLVPTLVRLGQPDRVRSAGKHHSAATSARRFWTVRKACASDTAKVQP